MINSKLAYTLGLSYAVIQRDFDNKGLYLKSFVLFLILFCTITINTEATDSLDQPFNKQASECRLIFGWTEWPPLQYFNPNGEISGIQIDLVNAVADKMGCHVTYIEKDWNQIVELIRDGEIDFTANATPSIEREKFAHFSDSYRRDSYAIYVRTEDFDKFNTSSIDDLKKTGIKLGLTRNHLYSSEIEQWKLDSNYNHNISYALSPSANMDRLILGEIEGSLEDPFIYAYKKRTKQITESLSRLPINIFGHKVSFMFSKKNVNGKFLKTFNDALHNIQQTAEFNSIWLDPQFNDK